MIYVVMCFRDSVTAVFDNPLVANKLARELNADAGYFLDNNSHAYPYTVEAVPLNDPEPFIEYIDDEDVLMSKEETSVG
jgi:hypothetical protein